MRALEHPTFLGIDLTGSGRRASAYALLDGGDRVLDLGFVGDDADILGLVERRAPRFVALDAPFGLPKGLCCLEESCPCSPESSQPGRACERELASRFGIPCFWTTKRTIIKPMVYRAIGLRAALEERGTEVLETYPYAIKVRLFGRDLPKKSTREGVAYLRRRLVALLPSLAPWSEGLGHDLCDAVVAAHAAVLHHRGGTEVLGDASEGAMVIPKGSPLVYNAHGTRLGSVRGPG